MKLRNRITLTFVAISAGTFFLMSIFIYFLASHFTKESFYVRLKARASLAAKHYEEKDEKALPIYEEVRKEHLLPLLAEQEFLFRYDSIQYFINSTKGLKLPASFYKNLQSRNYAEYNRKDRQYVGMLRNGKQGDIIVIVSAIDEAGEYMLSSLKKALSLGCILSSTLIFAGGIFYSRKVLDPVARIIGEVNNIGASNLHLRLETGNNNKDELSQLATTFNHMLDRLEASFEMQSNFVNNASHELKTPLTTLLGESEIILRHPRSCEEYVQSITVIQKEAERLNEILSSLLRMSQIGFDGNKLLFENVRFDDLIMLVKRNLDMRMPDNKVSIEWKNFPANGDQLFITVNRTWIKLALYNIIQNSIKYSNNDEVKVVLSESPETLEIKITDRGIGIPAQDLVHVFEPFFRGSNTAHFEGHGIGLPLSLKIIRLHKGKISVSSEKNKGTSVIITFPKEGIRNT